MANYAYNNKAKFDVDVKETLDAGLVLTGPEVKSVKEGNVSLAGSYITVNATGASLLNCHIGPYKYAKNENYNPTRTRALLLKKSEINKLLVLGKEKGLVMVPLEIYGTGRGLVKVKIGIGRGRKKQDKREYLKKREAGKEIRESSR